VAYIDLDKTGNQLIDLENQTDKRDYKIARYMLVIMLRGITSDFKYPLASFATDGITSDLLATVLWPAVEVVENTIGLKVLFITCDGASSNLSFFSLHGDHMTYFTTNPYDRSRKIFFISDPQHLIKTTRNCFANSDSHKMSRKLWKEDKRISWMDIVNLYHETVHYGIWSKSYHLSPAHINLTAFTQMKVSLAAQVLSKTVADALEQTYGNRVSETVEFVSKMNKFFDCLNTRSVYEGKRKCNSDLEPYRDLDDERLTWLENDFLGYFNEWRNSVKNRPGDFTKEERNQMMLSYQKIRGIQITTKSIVECVRFLLGEGAPYVLTNRFNQDPLEQFFGHCKCKGGSNDNRSVYDISNTITTLRAVGSVALAPVRGNTKRQNGAKEISNAPLELRKKQRR
jgi:hypothetical protein